MFLDKRIYPRITHNLSNLYIKTQEIKTQLTLSFYYLVLHIQFFADTIFKKHLSLIVKLNLY